MHRHGAVLTVVCVLLCMTFNYTFPLRRESSKWNIFGIHNDSRKCEKSKYQNVMDRTKKMAAHVENALKIMKESDNYDNSMKSKKLKNSPEYKNPDEDLSHFDQMVIKKKNPYLDLKELELKYYNPKNSRQSVDSNLRDPRLCESLEGPDVEITNRGLSGFAIPTKLLKDAHLVYNKKQYNAPLFSQGLVKLENTLGDGTTEKAKAKISKKESDQPNTFLLNTLEDDIRRFEERLESQ